MKRLKKILRRTLYPLGRKAGDPVRLRVYPTQDSMLEYLAGRGHGLARSANRHGLQGCTIVLVRDDGMAGGRGAPPIEIILYLEGTTAETIVHESTHAAVAWLSRRGWLRRVVRARKVSGANDELLAESVAGITGQIIMHMQGWLS